MDKLIRIKRVDNIIVHSYQVMYDDDRVPRWDFKYKIIGTKSWRWAPTTYRTVEDMNFAIADYVGEQIFLARK